MVYSDADRAAIGNLYADLKDKDRHNRWDVHTAENQNARERQGEALANLIKAYEEIATPVAEPVPTEERYDVILTAVGDKKIAVIRELRAIVRGLGLQDAVSMMNEVVIRGETSVLAYARYSDAIGAVLALESAGAKAHLERDTITPEEIAKARRGAIKLYEQLGGLEANAITSTKPFVS